MTAEATATVEPARRELSPLTEKLITHVVPEIKRRLVQQAALEGCTPAIVVNRVLADGLMSFEQIADATREQGSAARTNGNGAH